MYVYIANYVDLKHEQVYSAIQIDVCKESNKI